MFSTPGMSMRNAVVAFAASFCSVMALAQAPRGNLPREATITPGLESRHAVIQQLGLGNPSLKLTTAQRAQIEKRIEVYLAEKNLPGKTPAKVTARQNQELMAARMAERDKLAISLGQILDKQQRQILEETRNARLAQLSTFKAGQRVAK